MLPNFQISDLCTADILAGDFRPGGFVLKNPFDAKPQGGVDEKRFLKLQNGFNPKAHDYAEWVVAYEDLDQLYAKGDGCTLSVREDLLTAVRGLNHNVHKLADFCKKLDRRLAALEDRGGDRSS